MQVFFKKKKCLECPETKEYAKIVCEVFARVFVKIRGGQASAKNTRFFYVLPSPYSFFFHAYFEKVLFLN